jgi:hypothetical protein
MKGTLLAIGTEWLVIAAQGEPQVLAAALLRIVAAISAAASAVGFLFLVRRLCWGVREWIASVRRRERTESSMVELMREQSDVDPFARQQLWSAAAALFSC